MRQFEPTARERLQRLMKPVWTRSDIGWWFGKCSTWSGEKLAELQEKAKADGWNVKRGQIATVLVMKYEHIDIYYWKRMTKIEFEVFGI